MLLRLSRTRETLNTFCLLIHNLLALRLKIFLSEEIELLSFSIKLNTVIQWTLQYEIEAPSLNVRSNFTSTVCGKESLQQFNRCIWGEILDIAKYKYSWKIYTNRWLIGAQDIKGQVMSAVETVHTRTLTNPNLLLKTLLFHRFIPQKLSSILVRRRLTFTCI